MKKLFTVALLAGLLSAPASAAALGFIYENSTQPGIGSGSVAPSKVGTAVCRSYFGLVGLGDCSVASAMKNGNVKNLSHADVYTKNILGWKKIVVKAYGQ